MEAFELSTGDWVRRRGGSTPLKVLSVDDTNSLDPRVTLYDPVAKTTTAGPYAGDLEGIPMTVDLALRLGFTTNANDHTLTGSGWCRKWIEKSSTEIRLRPNNGILLIKVLDDHWFTLLDTVYCTHLHKFQHFLRMARFKAEIPADKILETN